jgi:hypothetical protein
LATVDLADIYDQVFTPIFSLGGEKIALGRLTRDSINDIALRDKNGVMETFLTCFMVMKPRLTVHSIMATSHIARNGYHTIALENVRFIKVAISDSFSFPTLIATNEFIRVTYHEPC